MTAGIVIERFNAAFDRRDADALAAVLTDDTFFEDTSPPDGRRITGKDHVVAYWREWFRRNPDAVIETEDMIVSGDRAIVLWVYHKTRDGKPWHLRGIDVFKVRDGRICEKRSYVKG